MIRKLLPKDLNQAVSVWLAASLQAHSFIAAQFWTSQKENMRDIYLPNSKSWVYETDNRILGFISYYKDFIPALFVDPKAQSQGVGRKLIHFVQGQYPNLTLSVYAENQRACQFYLRQGFRTIKTQNCTHTGREEIVMTWKRDPFS